MNVLKFLPVLFVDLCLASAAPELRDTFSCPEMDIDFMGRDIDTVHNIGSWQDCGKQLKLVWGTKSDYKTKFYKKGMAGMFRQYLLLSAYAFI